MQKVVTLQKPVSVFACAAVGGREEARGPLGAGLDFSD